MSQTKEQHVYQRGIRAARLWQRLKGTFLRWDRLCVSKARESKLPAWTGHIPIAMFGALTLIIFMFAGMVIASSAALLGGLILLTFSSKDTPIADHKPDDSEDNIYYDWDYDRFNGREYNPHRYNGWKDDD